MKKILFANISKVILFDTEEELEEYTKHLKERKRAYVIKSKGLEEGKIRVLIKEQYNYNDLLV